MHVSVGNPDNVTANVVDALQTAQKGIEMLFVLNSNVITCNVIVLFT